MLSLYLSLRVWAGFGIACFGIRLQQYKRGHKGNMMFLRNPIKGHTSRDLSNLGLLYDPSMKPVKGHDRTIMSQIICIAWPFYRAQLKALA